MKIGAKKTLRCYFGFHDYDKWEITDICTGSFIIQKATCNICGYTKMRTEYS